MQHEPTLNKCANYAAHTPQLMNSRQIPEAPETRLTFDARIVTLVFIVVVGAGNAASHIWRWLNTTDVLLTSFIADSSHLTTMRPAQLSSACSARFPPIRTEQGQRKNPSKDQHLRKNWQTPENWLPGFLCQLRHRRT